jgi:hypothetical protein
MQGRKIFSQKITPGARTASIKIPPAIARGIYVLSLKDASGKNNLADRVNLK